MIDTTKPGDVRIEKRRRPPLAKTEVDWALGDEPHYGHDTALTRAFLRTLERGCKQQVRREILRPGPRWIVQDVR